ncbi:hypothetical protein [Corallococcus aberystwythensis]|uniref:Uncharacterized protein n=1 Tax=Corallococcus aberystwythensis TaxID=2316722 RepID=A0A3A8PPI7_9BACT|nr:hypothetical protein [Corallococcus aberystwythensis]RKH58099.1 hypothetical protein D7W81_29720 [Corallococcus aberystwythensis]
MSLVKQQGILSPETRSDRDADVIMTAAVVGWAWSRLTNADVNKRHARIDFEVQDAQKLDKKELREQTESVALHISTIEKINQLLHATGLKPEQKVELGTTPIWTTGGRIAGGTGDKNPADAYRYNPPLPDGYAAKLFQLATDPATAGQLGYQGRGAYTGFIDGRTDGQTGLMSTFQHTVPFDDAYGRRWHPPEAPPDKTWGMILTTAMQDHVDPDESKQGLKQWGMHFEGPAPQRNRDICAYTHGMIQAIYDVHVHQLANDTSPNKKTPYNPGTPYEIAVGNKTTKLASCFPCSIFMEATGHAASSTHLGRGESWSPLYPPANPTTTQHKAWQACNAQWQAYCKSIIDAGLQCLKKAPAQLNADWTASVAALDLYLNGPRGVNKTPATAAQAYANLILDAVTVHDHEVKRVNRTLK